MNHILLTIFNIIIDMFPSMIRFGMSFKVSGALFMSPVSSKLLCSDDGDDEEVSGIRAETKGRAMSNPKLVSISF